jgi:hypothetical protein
MARKAPDAGAEGDPAPEIVPSEPSEDLGQRDPN